MGKVIEITEAQALQLKGKEYTKDMYFNPIQDAKDKWVISEEEIIQYKKATYNYIKSAPLKENEAKPTGTLDGKIVIGK
jgi:hypothetical protein